MSMITNKIQPNISVFIMTYNEEKNLPYCLESVKKSDDIVILDSFSNDRTKEVASLYPNVRFYEHAFENFSLQRNFGLHKVSYKNKWVFIIDADERCTPELWDEMIDKTGTSNKSIVSFSVCRKLYFQGRWMKHNSGYPLWVERLVIPEKIRFEGNVHEHLIYSGEQLLLKEHLIHHSFSKGICHWIQRMNNYTSVIASENKENKVKVELTKFVRKSPIERRRALKALFYKIPGRWIIFLVYNLVIKWCFLDGIRGIRYIILCSYIEFITTLKEKEKPEKLIL